MPSRRRCWFRISSGVEGSTFPVSGSTAGEESRIEFEDHPPCVLPGGQTYGRAPERLSDALFGGGPFAAIAPCEEERPEPGHDDRHDHDAGDHDDREERPRRQVEELEGTSGSASCGPGGGGGGGAEWLPGTVPFPEAPEPSTVFWMYR